MKYADSLSLLLLSSSYLLSISISIRSIGAGRNMHMRFNVVYTIKCGCKMRFLFLQIISLFENFLLHIIEIEWVFFLRFQIGEQLCAICVRSVCLSLFAAKKKQNLTNCFGYWYSNISINIRCRGLKFANFVVRKNDASVGQAI